MSQIKLQTILLILALVFFALANGNAQNGSSAQSEEESTATLQETLEWLKGKLNATSTKLSSGEAISTEWYLSPDNSKCTIGWKTTIHSLEGATSKTWKYAIDLSHIDLEGVKLSERYGLPTVVLPVYNSRDLIIWVIEEYKEGKIINKVGPDVKNREEIPFSDKDIAKRVVRALKHAIKLCGGKVEPF